MVLVCRFLGGRVPFNGDDSCRSAARILVCTTKTMGTLKVWKRGESTESLVSTQATAERLDVSIDEGGQILHRFIVTITNVRIETGLFDHVPASDLGPNPE